MKQKYIVCGALGLMLLVPVCILNWKYEVIALHPFRSEGRSELTVMTWNVYCSEGTDSIRQRRIAELILQEDADFVLLNEYNQDSCAVTDSMLKTRYPYTEEYQSHRRCGDIFYSKRKMSNSGHVWIPIRGKSIQTIKATVEMAGDSVQIFGVHMASNHYEGTSFGKEVKSDTTSYVRYRIAQENRCFQAHWTKEAVLESGHPVVVMGDMNDFNGSAPLDTLTSCGLRDSWWEGGNGYGTTFHAGWLRLRIDHILHSDGLELEIIRVIDTELSDHNPMVAGFRIAP